MNNKKEQEREELHKTIWKIANELRGSVDGWDFKQYVLGLLFYRFISENIEHYVNENQRKAGISNFEYRNISNSRIKYFEINFDICDAEGKVIETNSGSYFVDNLQLVPCDKTRVGWEAKSGKDAASITNVKVKEVRFSDGTVWKESK